jgi:hypothetical protein
MPALPRAKKRFGQHFLTDRHYVERIVRAIAPARGDSMVEIGRAPASSRARCFRTSRTFTPSRSTATWRPD